MRQTLLDLMACPQCQADLQLHAFTSDHEQVAIDGCLLCTGCQSHYRIVDAIPRMSHPNSMKTKYLSTNTAHNSPPFFPTKASYKRLTIPFVNTNKKPAAASAKNGNYSTVSAGMMPSGTKKRTTNRFYHNTYFDENELAGRLTLDAGYGNGRYAIQALKRNAQVVSIDLSQAVDVAQTNIGNNPHAHFVQGDLFKLPFKPGIF